MDPDNWNGKSFRDRSALEFTLLGGQGAVQKILTSHPFHHVSIAKNSQAKKEMVHNGKSDLLSRKEHKRFHITIEHGFHKPFALKQYCYVKVSYTNNNIITPYIRDVVWKHAHFLQELKNIDDMLKHKAALHQLGKDIDFLFGPLHYFLFPPMF